jgi:hypothetical protein
MKDEDGLWLVILRVQGKTKQHTKTCMGVMCTTATGVMKG